MSFATGVEVERSLGYFRKRGQRFGIVQHEYSDMREIFVRAKRAGWFPYFGMFHDALMSGAAFVLAFMIVIPRDQFLTIPGILEKTATFTVIATASLVLFRMYRTSWRYASIPEVMTVIKASIFAAMIYTAVYFVLSRAENVPRSVPILTAILMIAGLTGSRLAYRLIVEQLALPVASRNRRATRRHVLVYGFTDEAESFIRSARREQSPFVIHGIVDDNRFNHKRTVQGIKVLGPIREIDQIQISLGRKGVDVVELIVADQLLSQAKLGSIVETATGMGIRVLRLPETTHAALVTNTKLMEPKAIELSDLLGRPEVRADMKGVASIINGRIVLVTGAGGSIGSELCRQIAMLGPGTLIITDNSEFLLYMLDKQLRDRHPALHIVTRILDVRDKGRVHAIFEEFEPEAVFHAAALKHVPLVEENPLEGMKTNLLGTRNVADAALAHGTASFVMISTDKAVNPTNVMGATKRAAESYCQALDVASSTTRFKTVRFGNVLGSNGSVVPRFKEQIAAGGPVTVTHPDIIRFFMTIPEAVRLVLHASAHALQRKVERGKIMVLDMGQPVRIVDLAERMIQLAGFKPYTDINIVFTGLRPGEKLYEELFENSEVREDAAPDGYFVASPRLIDRVLLGRSIADLEVAISREETARALIVLRHMVPEFRSDTAQMGSGRNKQSSDLDAGPQPHTPSIYTP